MHVAANKPEWAANEIRLDPNQLPQQVSYERRPAQNTVPTSSAVSGMTSDISFSLDTKGAVMKGNLTCGLPVSMALPSRAFRGIAARAFQNDDGSTTVTLEALHRDPSLSVPLLVSNTMDDIAADWHSWSRTLQLPMLIVEADGRITRLHTTLGMVQVKSPTARRRRYFALKHRPRFLRRRKTGIISELIKLTPAEIIART